MKDETLETAKVVMAGVVGLVAWALVGWGLTKLAVRMGALVAWGLTKLVVGVQALVAWAPTKPVSSSSSGLETLFEANYERLFRWRFPASGKLKMNTDCSVTDSQAGLGGRAGYGVVIRDERGSWKMGAYGKLKDCSSCEAELLAVYNGLQIIQRLNFGKVFEIESDCEPVVHLINGKTHTKLPSIKEKVDECKSMLQKTGCELKHIGNKANKVANEMAERGRDQDKGYVTFSPPPDQKIERLLDADVKSATYV